MSSVARRAGVFLGVLVLATAVGAVALGVGSQPAPGVSEVDTNDTVVDTPAEDGEVSVSEDGSGTVVVIDTTRSSSVSPETIAPMAEALTESGATVRYTSGGSGASTGFGPSAGGGLNQSLRGADAYVVFGSSQSYTDSEVAGIQAFTDAGGRVLLMNEPGTSSPSAQSLFGPSRQSSAPSPLVPLTSQYGVAYDNGYLFNMANNSNNYRSVYVTPTGETALTEGVDRAVFHEAVSVSGGQTALTTTEGTELSSTRRADTYGVLTRQGNVVAVGDSSIATQEFVYRADNEVLVGNLLDFLVSAEKTPENVPRGSSSGAGGGTGGGFGGGSGGTTPPIPDNDTTPIPDNDTVPVP